jgi:predicted Zn-dependent protease
MNKIKIILFSALVFSACKSAKNESDLYSECNRLMGACLSSEADYCLFGYKWGMDKYFSPWGDDVTGPRHPGGGITFSFQNENGLVNTHSQINLPSLSFDRLPAFAKEETRKAFQAWEGIADLQFKEMEENSDTQIKLFTAEIKMGGVSFPNIDTAPCDKLAGSIIIQADLKIYQERFYTLMLHEIGHSLGLGHVKSANIMSTEYYKFNTVQAGDSLGIIEIYGPK